MASVTKTMKKKLTHPVNAQTGAHQRKWQDLLASGAVELGIDLDDSQMRLMAAFVNELLDANQRFNLTRLTDPLEIAESLILDSVYPGKFINDKTSVLDLGTGAGFPGIPLKIARPQLSFTLIDSRRRKINFLKFIIRQLGLEEIRADHVRAEDLAGGGWRFGCVITRAVATLTDLIRLGFPLLGPEGVLIAMKGPSCREEIDILKKSKPIQCRDVLVDPVRLDIQVKSYQLPASGIDRALIFVRVKGTG